MIRTALRPRWLAWLAVALAALYVCVLLGRWQLGVARDDAAKDALNEVENRPVAPISQVVEPHQTWDGRVMANRRVSLTGAYEERGQFLVPNRVLDGRIGYWVVTPFRTADPAGTIAVVRGWVASPSAPAPPAGSRTVTGSLAQGEAPAEVGAAALPPGQEPSIDLARLVNEWEGPLYNGFAFALSEQPAAPAGLRLVPPPQPESGLHWRNAAYALQWWVFGAFCPLLWWRMVRSAHEERRLLDGAPDPTMPDADPAAERPSSSAAQPSSDVPSSSVPEGD